MTTIRHWLIVEFGGGASNQAVATGITRPLQATGPPEGFDQLQLPETPFSAGNSRLSGQFSKFKVQ